METHFRKEINFKNLMCTVWEDFILVSINIIVSLKNKAINCILSSTPFLSFLSFSLNERAPRTGLQVPHSLWAMWITNTCHHIRTTLWQLIHQATWMKRSHKALLNEWLSLVLGKSPRQSLLLSPQCITNHHRCLSASLTNKGFLKTHLKIYKIVLKPFFSG